MNLNGPDCLPCVANFHWECIDLRVEDDLAECCCPEPNSLSAATESGERNPFKENAYVTDPKSTGRKRAALLYPLPKEDETPFICEWRNLRYAGGGVYPIIGCVNGVASNRHHGPDKDTMNNAMGNVHRICPTCHNRWHSLNDPLYSIKYNTSDWKNHDAETKATVEEQLKNETKWVQKPAERVAED